MHEGEITPFHVGIYGAMNAQRLTEIGAQVRRHAEGNIAKGLVAGSKAYGYDVVYIDELWYAAQKRRERDYSGSYKKSHYTKFELSCFCKRCGSQLIRADVDYLACPEHLHHNQCTQAKLFSLVKIDEFLRFLVQKMTTHRWQVWMDNLQEQRHRKAKTTSSTTFYTRSLGFFD